MFITFLHSLCAGHSFSYSFSFLGEMAKTSNNEVNKSEHVYCPLAATVQNDSQINEPELIQASSPTENVI